MFHFNLVFKMTMISAEKIRKLIFKIQFSYTRIVDKGFFYGDYGTASRYMS
jgi:hypothetical protein